MKQHDELKAWLRCQRYLGETKSCLTEGRPLESRCVPCVALAAIEQLEREKILVGPLGAISRELERATAKFPTWPARGIDAAAIVAEESGELQRAVLQATYEGGSVEAVQAEAIETAAMAIQFLLNLPVTRFDGCEQVPKASLGTCEPQA